MRAIAHLSALGAEPMDREAPLFRDRVDAGERLAKRLLTYRGEHVLVLGIPRGGMPVAAVVAQALEAELDVVVARKLGSPVSEELAIGAVTAEGGRYLNDSVVRSLGVDESYIDHVTRAQVLEAQRRESRFRGGAPAAAIPGRTVILVDDCLATGSTMVAAARAVRAKGPARLIVAVPVGSREAVALLQHETDEVVCLSTPEPFWAVGVYYRDFGQTEDREVETLLQQGRRSPAGVSTTSQRG